MAQEGNTAIWGKNEINLTYESASGETATEVYKLPETGMLPDNIMYGFKTIRDYLWLAFSQGIDKPKMAVLVADKKAAEFGKLLQRDKNDLAIESGNEAINKLEYAYNLTKDLNGVDVQKEELLRQIYMAGRAYKEMFLSGVDKFSLDPEKINTLLNKTDDWNKTQEKARFDWDH